MHLLLNPIPDEVMHLFHDLLLMADGHLVYFGENQGVAWNVTPTLSLILTIVGSPTKISVHYGAPSPSTSTNPNANPYLDHIPPRLPLTLADIKPKATPRPNNTDADADRKPKSKLKPKLAPARRLYAERTL